MGIFIFNDSFGTRAIKSDNIVRLALGERDLPDDEVSLILTAAFSPTTLSGNELGVFEKAAVGKEDTKAVSELRALHLDLLDLMAGTKDIVNISSLQYPCKPKGKDTSKAEQPAPEKSE